MFDKGVRIKLCGKGGWGSTGKVQIDARSLIGGAPKEDDLACQSPEEIWPALTFGISPQAEITFPREVKAITGLIVHENPKHPEAFPSIAAVDARVDGKWQRVWQGLINPGADHHHIFAQPVNADAIRYIPIGCTLNGVYVQSIEVLSEH